MKKNKIASCEGHQQAPIEHNNKMLMNTNKKSKGCQQTTIEHDEQQQNIEKECQWITIKPNE